MSKCKAVLDSKKITEIRIKAKMKVSDKKDGFGLKDANSFKPETIVSPK